MSSEQNAPEVGTYQGQPAPPAAHDQDGQFSGNGGVQGMGQSKSSRRRRRKRKNKGGGAEFQESPQASGEQSAGQPVGNLQAAAQPQGNSQQGSGQQNQNGTKRWKKKFRDRQRGGGGGGEAQASGGGYRDRDTHQPGNTVSGFKRKGGSGGGGKQQRGPRGFVGPMDHSYRAVNGNFADGPPSTIETGGNGNYGGRGGSRTAYPSDSQPIDYSVGRPIPIPEDAPTRIYFFIEDLFFTAKIQETSRKLGVKVAFVKGDKDAIAALTDLPEEQRPGLIVFDLNNVNVKPLTLIPKLKSKLKRSTSIIGFLSHLQGDLKAKATEAGCDVVMPRAAFSQNLPNLLRRYGSEQEDEPNYNQ
ncbi:MAG: response regulator [Acidobacteriota bacterium]|nr:response regulator [Acidobacteriota bacterium]